jgi:hypothetical protein
MDATLISQGLIFVAPRAYLIQHCLLNRNQNTFFSESMCARVENIVGLLKELSKERDCEKLTPFTTTRNL